MNKIIAALPLLFLISFFFLTSTYSGGPNMSEYELPEDDAYFGGVFLKENIKENMSLKDYNTYSQIFKNAKSQIDNKNNFNIGSSFSTFGGGLGESYDSRKTIDNYFSNIFLMSNDSAFYQKEKQRIIACIPPSIKTEKQYYFMLGGFELDDEFKKFFVLGDKNYLAIPIADKKDTSIKNLSTTFRYARKEIKVGYNTTTKILHIPISKTTNSILNILLLLFSFGILVLGLSITFYFPYNIIKNISKGEPFAEQNIVELKFMLKYSIILSTFLILLPFILHLILYNWIPSDFKFVNYKNIFSNLLFSYLYCLVIYSIYKAFKKGNDLQQENELTV